MNELEIQVIRQQLNQKRLRVGAYCRVSTDVEEQENSLENQISHYESMITSNPMYELTEVYRDFGISGFKEKRPGFQKMMKDAKAGKMDLIITKSISRFARNTVTVLKAARELKEQGVGIFFELQNINTLTEAGELMLTVISAFAQAESENYSALAKLVYRRKYEKGIPVQYLERSFGYTKNEKGDFIPDPVEAKWVIKIYEMIADGYTTADVKRYLNEQKVKTARGAAFTESTVVRMVENEIYKGDFMMHKHYVNADRKLVRNQGQVDAWYVSRDHKPIVSKRLWQKAQDLLAIKRDYLAGGSVVGELNQDTYPYLNQIYCARCGYPLYRRVYSNGNRVSWECSGKKRFLKGFCTGINVPDSVIRSWGKFNGNIYLWKETDDLGKFKFEYVAESTWMKRNKVKKHDALVELNEVNFPYYKKIYCKKCGSRLVRLIQGNGNVLWICNGWKRKGKDFCSGIRISDKEIRSWGEIKTDIYIEGKDGNDGKKCYGYTCKSGEE